MKHFLVCYIDRVNILSLKIIQIQAYHRKTYVDFVDINKCYSSQQEKHICNTKLQIRIIKVVLSNFSYLIANWTSYPNLLRSH